MGKLLALVLLTSACGPAPRCVVRGVAIHGGTFECSSIESAITIAELELNFEVPPGSITFRAERTWRADGDVVNGLAWCFPFEAELGSGALLSPESAMAHELAHWMVGLRAGDADCARGDGAAGHLGWKESGISDAIHRWTLRGDRR